MRVNGCVCASKIIIFNNYNDIFFIIIIIIDTGVSYNQLGMKGDEGHVNKVSPTLPLHQSHELLYLNGGWWWV